MICSYLTKVVHMTDTAVLNFLKVKVDALYKTITSRTVATNKLSHAVLEFWRNIFNFRRGFRGGAGRAAAPPFGGIFVRDL